MIIEKTEEVINKIQNDLTQAELLIRKLEYDKTWELYRQKHRDSFCILYLIKITQEYVMGEDYREIMLLSFNLLDGFSSISTVKERYEAYVEQTLNSNSSKIVKAWGDPYKSLKNIITSCSKNLAKMLEANAIEDKDRQRNLGLAARIIDELPNEFPDGLPESIPLPIPRCFQNDSTLSRGQSLNKDNPKEALLKNKTKPEPEPPKKKVDIKYIIIGLTIIFLIIGYNSQRKDSPEARSIYETSPPENEPILEDRITTEIELKLPFLDFKKTTIKETYSSSENIGEVEGF